MTELEQLHADLAEFEQRYQFSSAEFYHRYRAGQTDDRMDFVEWASLLQIVEKQGFDVHSALLIR